MLVPLQRFCLFTLCFLFAWMAQAQPAAPVLSAKAWVLVEFGSGQELVAHNPEEKLEPASLTKLMTAYLTFSALRQKKIALTDQVTVSEKAWRMGGSKMFIRVGTKVKIEELILGMVVQSGNDASVALAEAIAGDENTFVSMMNQEAIRLGLKSTQFRNATGLPDPEHRSTARDLSLLAFALIRDFPEEYARYYRLKEYRYGEIAKPQQNRNLLLGMDPSVDGVKTGFTELAGYCLIASAQRQGRRLLSVVLGTSSEVTRAQESLKLLNWGYQSHDAIRLYAAGQTVSSSKVWKGSVSTVPVGFSRDFIVSVPKGQGGKLKAELTSRQPLIAPVHQGETIGTLRLTLEGRPYGEFTVVALEEVAVGGWFRRLIDTIRLWFS